jgi:hypothetical protein
MENLTYTDWMILIYPAAQFNRRTDSRQPRRLLVTDSPYLSACHKYAKTFDQRKDIGYNAACNASDKMEALPFRVVTARGQDHNRLL